MKFFKRERVVSNGCMVFLVIISFSIRISAQSPGTQAVNGKVTDSLSSAPLAFATVQVYSYPSQKVVTESISSNEGDFSINLSRGKYYVKVSFMGFRTYSSAAFNISKENPTHNIGRILLARGVSTLEEVIVEGEKKFMQLAFDKKIFNVGQDPANAGGSALDVLSNIPSLSVDPEGRVKLRGSDNVRILIDGKPSGLVTFKGGSGLQQLQASMIESVEIITNPSARYEAEGMAGILNIILKKEKRQGFNGSLEVNAGNPANFGAAANLNYRHKRVNFFINYGLSYRKSPYQSNLYQEVYAKDTLSILRQENEGFLRGFNNNIRGGIDFYFTEKSVLTGSYLFRRSDANRVLDIRYEDYLFNTSNLQNISKRRQDENEDEPNSEYTLTYKRSFKEKDHELTAEIKYLDNWESSTQLFTQKLYGPNESGEPVQEILQNSLNDEWEKQFLVQVDYIKPLGNEGKFETGLRTSIRKMTNDYVVSQQDSTGEFIPFAEYDNVFFYDENIHAAYGILANKHKRISYQAGLRAEWTDVKTTLEKTNEINPRNYMNLFPSIHFTYDMPKENALQASYSRRVRRPFYNDLSPFFTFSDSRNYFSGNPDLEPEFSDVFEIGHIKTFEKGTFSSSVYYRNTKGKIQSIRTVDEEGKSTTLPKNLLSEKAIGAEFISNYSPFPWWKNDLNVNFFYSDIDGSNIIRTFTTQTYSWFTRYTSKFSLPRNFDLQVRINYEAPRNTVQGKERSLYFADLSASKDIFKGKGTINFNVLDLFNSRRSRSVFTGPNFFTRGEYQFRKRQVNLSMSYRIRQAKPAKAKTEQD